MRSGGMTKPLFKLWNCAREVVMRKYLGRWVAKKCRAPLHGECPQHHGHKGDPGVTHGTCGAIGERDQVILMWVRAPGV
jgi:hypothetical protein